MPVTTKVSRKSVMHDPEAAAEDSRGIHEIDRGSYIHQSPFRLACSRIIFAAVLCSLLAFTTVTYSSLTKPDAESDVLSPGNSISAGNVPTLEKPAGFRPATAQKLEEAAPTPGTQPTSIDNPAPSTKTEAAQQQSADTPTTQEVVLELIDGSEVLKQQLQKLPTPPEVKLMPGWQWDRYHSYNEIIAFLQYIAEAAPHCAKTYSIGKSVLGKELQVLELSDFSSPKKPSFKPAIKMMAGMHGDELPSIEVVVHFAFHVASSFGRDPRITELLASSTLLFLPMVNADGVSGNTRYNANNVDLNRNYPLDRFNYPKPTPDITGDAVEQWRRWGDGKGQGVQPENQAIMNWANEVPSVLSFSAHGGALVANYPFDACDQKGVLTHCPTPEDPLPLFIAQVYSFNHPLMRINREEGFINGTTQGAKWYPVMASMQDWLFHNTADLDITLELHSHKQPESSFALDMWQHNVMSMMRFSEMAHLGVRGVVVDAANPFQLLESTVEIISPKGVRPPHMLPPSTGSSFFKLLAPEQDYCLKVTVKGRAQQVLLAVRVGLRGEDVIYSKGLSGLMLGVKLMVGMGKGAQVLTVGGADKGACHWVAE